MAKHNSKYPGKCFEWKARLSQQESSGKTIEAWCEENSISIRTFFRWKKRLSKEPPIISEPPITPTQLQPVITANAPKTLSDVYAEYCEKGRSDRAYATRRKQDTLWEQHIKEKFGFRLLESIQVQEVQDYLIHLYYDEGYSFQYVESFLKMFYLIFGQAFCRGYLSSDRYNMLCQNKLTKIHMPKMKFDEDTEIHIFERDQLEKLDEYFSGTNLELAYLLGRYCGLRINECFGLTWSHVNLDEGTITIQYQMMYQEGIIKLVQPKTRNAFRTIYLHDRVLEYLQKRKDSMDNCTERQKWQRLRKACFIMGADGNPISTLELVNSLPDGTMQTGNSMKYHARTIQEKFGFAFKYHYLRHTYGTQLAMLNTPTHILCKQMGHGNIHVTEKYYIAVSKDGVDILKEHLAKL